MTKTTLERATAAAMTVCIGFNEEGEEVYIGSNTAQEFARAVLMAVRDPDDGVLFRGGMSSPEVADAGHPGLIIASFRLGFTSSIDAILNEGEK